MNDVKEMFVPLNDRVLIEVEVTPEKTEGGIWLPPSAVQKSEMGWVRAVAEGIDLVDIGEKILFDKYAGTVLELEKKMFIVIPTDSILGVMKE